MLTKPAMIRPRAGILPAALGVLWLVAALARLPSQAAAVLLPEAPSGFNTPLPEVPSELAASPAGESAASGLGERLLDGLKLTTSFSSYYNTNVAPTQNTADNSQAKDDFILSLGGTLNYLSKASALTFGGNYHGNYNQYFNHSAYSGYSQGGGMVVNYEGGRFSISGTVGMSIAQGSNSNYSSAFVEQTTVNSALTARYRLSPKTSLVGNFSQNFTTASGGNYSDTSSYTLGASALWKYSPLTEFGPGIRYTYRTGSSQLGRTSVGPTLSVNYKLSKKVALNSRFGMDFSSYEDGTSADPTFSASLGVNYQASKLWGMNFSLYRDTQADPSSAGAYTEVTSLRLGCHRKVRRATWNVGTSYRMNSSVLPGNAASSNRPDQDYLTLDTSLGMPLFSNTTYGSVFLQFNDQRGSVTNTWSSIQAGFSINRSF